MFCECNFRRFLNFFVFRFSDLLGGFLGFSEVVFFVGTVYRSERVEVRVRKGRR